MKPNTIFDEGLLTVREAAQMLTVTKATVYNLMSAGKIPSTRVGRLRRIPRRALLEYLTDGLEGGW